MVIDLASRMRKWSDNKLTKELTFAEGFYKNKSLTNEERNWLDALRAENKRRSHGAL